MPALCPSTLNFPSALPSERLMSVAPSDADELPFIVRQLYVGSDGNVTVETIGGDTVTFNNVPAGSHLGPFRISRVRQTGTSATGLVGYL
ncbi:MAG: spike base protein, RCAP_Rcc01079 family [Vogesella sp.]|uniref:spike base protein, RCAP_Rcc01079 family n=1 Tax=Vogesella sp. TaxID=1904252 RepID=UPI003F3D65B0